MPDILIRGVKMPKTCADCYDAGLPTAIAFFGTKCPNATGCPLHELPEHGDLIDRDATMDSILGEPPEAHYPAWYAANVNEMPVIVPANKEKSE